MPDWRKEFDQKYSHLQADKSFPEGGIVMWQAKEEIKSFITQLLAEQEEKRDELLAEIKGLIEGYFED